MTGSQNYKKEHQTVYHGFCKSPYYIYCQAIRADKVGEGDKRIMLHNSMYSEQNFNHTLMFFQKR